MTERIQKIISEAGVMSRRAAERAMLEGRVTVNGVDAVPGEKADPEKDEILVDGVRLKASGTRRYLMLNKPKGYITSMHDEKGRHCVEELVRDAGERVYPIGRLDMYSEGLLLLTNDGDFANRVMHPSRELDKCYHTWVTGTDLKESLRLLQSPMEIDGYRIRPAVVSVLEGRTDAVLLSITIHEGRNRQIRKMCRNAGLKVIRLQRVSVGGLLLGDLRPGEWRELTPRELEEIWNKKER